MSHIRSGMRSRRPPTLHMRELKSCWVFQQNPCIRGLHAAIWLSELPSRRFKSSPDDASCRPTLSCTCNLNYTPKCRQSWAARASAAPRTCRAQRAVPPGSGHASSLDSDQGLTCDYQLYKHIRSQSNLDFCGGRPWGLPDQTAEERLYRGAPRNAQVLRT